MSDSAGVASGLSPNTRRYLVILALLVVALTVMGVIYSRGIWQSQFITDDGYVFVTDIDRWRRTQREQAVTSVYDFSLGPQLEALPLEIGEWQGADVPQTNIEVQILLEPEEYVYRRYRRPDGKYVWLSVIGSRQAKSFHSPQICYDADGWKTAVASEAIDLGNGKFYALKLEAEKGRWEQVVLYFYLYPDYLREANSGTVLFKVTAPLEGSVEETIDLQKGFIKQFFNDVHL